MSKLVRSTVLSHIGIFNSNSSIFYWEHPHIMYNGKKRDVVILQVVPHDEERFLVEFIVSEDEYDIVEKKRDERYENAINTMKRPTDVDSIFGKRYVIHPFEDFKDHILEKFPHEKMGDRDVKSMYPYPEHFILTDIKKQECISADSGIADAMDYVIGRANQAALDEQYMREAVCDKLSKALNKGDKKDEQND